MHRRPPVRLPSVCVTGSAKRSIRCAGALVFDDTGRLLLVRRLHEPGKGRWSLPGGRVEPGETDYQAVCREVLEETGLEVSVTGWAGAVRRPAPDGGVFEISDYVCTVTGGTLRAGDDADEVRWCDRAALASLPVVVGLIEELAKWGRLPG